MASPLVIRLPKGITAEVENILMADQRRPVRIELPESWCYRILLPNPPKGWSRKQRELLRPSLLPEPLEDLQWDEEVHSDRGWTLWAVSKSRFESATRSFTKALFQSGRPIRVCPYEHAGRTQNMAAFPNLAPSSHRRSRLPWARVRVTAFILIPILTLVIGGWGIGGVVRPRWTAMLDQEKRLTAALVQAQVQVSSERLANQRFKDLASGKGVHPLWLTDLDALTRLIPEDSFLVGITWSPEEVQIDLVTPNPELIRNILEAAPEFDSVTFQGNLERQGQKSRLILSLHHKAAR